MNVMTATRKMATQAFFLGWTTLAVWTLLDVYRCADSTLNHLLPLFLTSFLMILPLAFASSFISLALTSPIVVSWREFLGQKKSTPEVALILPYLILVVIVGVHLSLYTGDLSSNATDGSSMSASSSHTRAATPSCSSLCSMSKGVWACVAGKKWRTSLSVSRTLDSAPDTVKYSCTCRTVGMVG